MSSYALLHNLAVHRPHRVLLFTEGDQGRLHLCFYFQSSLPESFCPKEHRDHFSDFDCNLYCSHVMGWQCVQRFISFLAWFLLQQRCIYHCRCGVRRNAYTKFYTNINLAHGAYIFSPLILSWFGGSTSWQLLIHWQPLLDFLCDEVSCWSLTVLYYPHQRCTCRDSYNNPKDSGRTCILLLCHCVASCPIFDNVVLCDNGVQNVTPNTSQQIFVFVHMAGSCSHPSRVDGIAGTGVFRPKYVGETFITMILFKAAGAATPTTTVMRTWPAFVARVKVTPLIGEADHLVPTGGGVHGDGESIAASLTSNMLQMTLEDINIPLLQSMCLELKLVKSGTAPTKNVCVALLTDIILRFDGDGRDNISTLSSDVWQTSQASPKDAQHT